MAKPNQLVVNILDRQLDQFKVVSVDELEYVDNPYMTEDWFPSTRVIIRGYRSERLLCAIVTEHKAFTAFFGLPGQPGPINHLYERVGMVRAMLKAGLEPTRLWSSSLSTTHTE